MKILHRVSEQYMVATFLAAEAGSPRVGWIVRKAMRSLGVANELVVAADLDDAEQNKLRDELLARTRGWKSAAAHLLGGFPTGVKWYRAELEAAEIEELRYLNSAFWLTLSDGSLRVKDAVNSIRQGGATVPEKTRRFFMDPTAEMFMDVAAGIERGQEYPEMILIASDECSTTFILEGHLRATAYGLTGKPGPIRAVFGTHPAIRLWAERKID